MEGKPVDWYSDVFDVVFPNLNKDYANALWRERLKKPSKKEAEEDRD
jgi:Lon-like ATP-dependent protease